MILETTSLFIISYVLVWIVVAVQGVVVFLVAHQIARIYRAVESSSSISLNPFPPGTVAPTFAAIDLGSGKSVGSDSLLGKPCWLLFLSSRCRDCRRIAAGLSELNAIELSKIIILCDGQKGECRNLIGDVENLTTLWTSRQQDIAAVFRINALPVAVRIDDRQRIVAYRFPTSIGDIRSYLTTEEPNSFRNVQFGESAIAEETAL